MYCTLFGIVRGTYHLRVASLKSCSYGRPHRHYLEYSKIDVVSIRWWHSSQKQYFHWDCSSAILCYQPWYHGHHVAYTRLPREILRCFHCVIVYRMCSVGGGLVRVVIFVVRV